MVVLTAGHETTSFTLGSCTYILVRRSEIQDKAYEEICEQLELAGPVVDYDFLVSKLAYMDIFIREVLRMYPVSIQTINRQFMEDADICGYKITKGKKYFILIKCRLEIYIHIYESC
jgi:cytochrome P450